MRGLLTCLRMRRTTLVLTMKCMSPSLDYHLWARRGSALTPPENRLEFVGDSVLSLSVTTILKDMYPHLRVGPFTVRCEYIYHVID